MQIRRRTVLRLVIAPGGEDRQPSYFRSARLFLEFSHNLLHSIAEINNCFYFSGSHTLNVIGLEYHLFLVQSYSYKVRRLGNTSSC